MTPPIANAPSSTGEPASTGLRTSPRPTCPICAGGGEVKYAEVGDKLFGVPGSWNLRSCRDAGCGCLWLDPCPLPADIGKAYDAYYTHGSRSPAVERMIERAWGFLGRAFLTGKYRRSIAGTPAVVGAVVQPLLGLVPDIGLHLELLLRHLPPPQPQQKLLDVGCGEGLSLHVLSRVGWQVEGQDVDAQALAVTARRGIRVKQGQLADCGYADGTFDAVTMSHVIEHVHDAEALLREIHRILRPGGTLVSITPNVDSAALQRFGSNWIHLDPPRHLTLFTAAASHTIARRAGFVTTEVTSSVRVTSSTEVASRHIRQTGSWRWAAGGSVIDRVAGRYRLYQQLLQGDAEKLRGDELILIARKDLPS
jgi:2-polyprenyl-3-methyl-5-hydroxy-6-metoxy-1,4-benzoquinol methylase